MNKKKDEAHSHFGHRQRFKEEFLSRGLEGMPEHKILELMLFFSIPNGDTNEIAHALYDRFGSLRDVINASFEELQEVKGIKSHSATMICFFRELSKIYLSGELRENVSVDNMEALNQYCKTLFIKSRVEEIYCIFLDDELCEMGCEKLCEGTFGAVDLSMRTIVEAVVKGKCNRIVITHNHPNGSCMPSRNDINATVEIWKLMRSISVELEDHVIIGRDGEWSMRHNKTLPQIWRG